MIMTIIIIIIIIIISLMNHTMLLKFILQLTMDEVSSETCFASLKNELQKHRMSYFALLRNLGIIILLLLLLIIFLLYLLTDNKVIENVEKCLIHIFNVTGVPVTSTIKIIRSTCKNNMDTLQRCLRSRKLQRLGKCCFLVILLTCFIWQCVFNFSKNRPNRKKNIRNYSFTLGGSTTNNSYQVEPFVGAMNIHIWRELCGFDVTNLRQHLFFPRYPSENFKHPITEFQIEDNSLDYGQVIFGFVHPPNTMSYRFAIVSDDTSELWLSSSEDPNQKQLIARVFTDGDIAWAGLNQLDKYPDQISQDMYLLKGSKYYLEVLHKQGIGDGFVQVFWKSFQEKKFKLISSEYLSPYSDNTSVAEKKHVFHSVLSERYHYELEQKFKRISKEYLDFYSLPLIPKDSYLTSCEYKSSVAYDVIESLVYPEDDTVMGDGEDGWPNRVADGDSIQAVVDKVTTSLRLKTYK